MKALRLVLFSAGLLLAWPDSRAAEDSYYPAISARVTVSYAYNHPGRGKKLALTAYKRDLPTPSYPADMLLQGNAGVVEYRCSVAPDGTIEKVEVLNASFPAFAESVERALRTWAFEVSNEGEPLVSIKGKIVFEINPQE